MTFKKAAILITIAFTMCFASCKKTSNAPTSPSPPPTPPTVTNEVDFWLTKGDQSVKFEKQNTVLAFTSPVNIYPNIDIDLLQTYQSIDGFGYTLTGGSAQVINQLNATKKQELLQDLFGSTGNAIAINYLRVSIGASDMNAAPFTYNDLPTGQTDVTLSNFSLANDMTNVIPLLKEILLINPNIKIMATPWTAPTWMKDNNSFIGGSLQTPYYNVYAQYFVKYIQKMKLEGINIDAVCPQNEPLYGGNNPSMLISAVEQSNFIKNNLGPAFQTNNITTKIIIYDHNCDRPDYPISILADATTASYVNGSAFHLYGGDISALTTVHNSAPTKNIYFTEQFTASNGDFGGDLKWHLKNVIIGSMRNWSKNALEWNLANDGNFGPHTIGGCNTCKGAITVESTSTYTKNVGFYIVAHASKFVPVGSIRIATNLVPNLNNVAFKVPSGKIVLLVENDGTSAALFNIKFNGKWVTTSLDAGAVGTYIF
jgi:O-glycosyl hydrolase